MTRKNVGLDSGARKVIICTTLVAALAGGIPLLVSWRRAESIKQLTSLPPSNATKVLRKVLSSATEVRIHVRTYDSYEPLYFANKTALIGMLNRTSFTSMHGRELKELIGAIHAGVPGDAKWHQWDWKQPIPGSVDYATALDFFAGEKWLAEIRIGKSYGLRWYKPPQYIGEIRLAPESYPYLERAGIFSVMG